MLFQAWSWDSFSCLFWEVFPFSLVFGRWNASPGGLRSCDWHGQSKTFHFFCKAIILLHDEVPSSKTGCFFFLNRFRSSFCCSHHELHLQVKLVRSFQKKPCKHTPWHYLHCAWTMSSYVLDHKQILSFSILWPLHQFGRSWLWFQNFSGFNLHFSGNLTWIPPADAWFNSYGMACIYLLCIIFFLQWIVLSSRNCKGCWCHWLVFEVFLRL